MSEFNYEYAIIQGIFQFNVESVVELHLINKVALINNKKASIAIRINPDVAVNTHKKITPGTAQNKSGINISVLDLGGGLGVCYDPMNDVLPNMQEYHQIIEDELSAFSGTYLVEPGRSLTADTGCLVSQVIYEKSTPDKNFLIIDAAMNDFARPSLYDAYHHIAPVVQSTPASKKYDIGGPVCESGDTFAEARVLPQLHSGDFVVIKD